MSKIVYTIVDGIKSFGLSAIKWFQERKQDDDDAKSFEPSSPEGKVFDTAETRVKKLEQDQRSFFESSSPEEKEFATAEARVKKLERDGNQLQEDKIQALNNGTSTSEFQKSIKVSDVDYLDPNTKEGQELASAMRPIAKRLNEKEQAKKAGADGKSIGE